MMVVVEWGEIGDRGVNIVSVGSRELGGVT